MVTQYTYNPDPAHAQQLEQMTVGAGTPLAQVTTYTYDALNRLIQVIDTDISELRYNGDGVLVAQITNGRVTRYLPDLAAPLDQVLQITQGSSTSRYIYGQERLLEQTGSQRTWSATDALGSLRRTLDDAGGVRATAHYDPWGTPTTGLIAPFGFTGELHDDASGLVYLRARWYHAASGTFTSVDPFEGFPELPYSQHPYQYGYSDPVRNTDPSGEAIAPPIIRICPLLYTWNKERKTCVRNPDAPSLLSETTDPLPPILPSPLGMVQTGVEVGTEVGGQIVAEPLKNFVVTAAAEGCRATLPIWIRIGSLVTAGITLFSTIVPPAVPPKQSSRGMSVFMPGGDTPLTTDHISYAIYVLGKPDILTYRGPNNGHSRRWLRRAPACNGQSMLQWCDEFPFNSVDEGGQANNPSLRLVPSTEQRIQGGKWSGFLSSCHVLPGEKVKIEPNIALPETIWNCR